MLEKIHLYEEFMESLTIPICIKDKENNLVFQNSLYINLNAEENVQNNINELPTIAKTSCLCSFTPDLKKSLPISIHEFTPSPTSDDNSVYETAEESLPLKSFEYFLNQLPIIAIVTSEIGKSLFYNKKWEEYTGYDVKETLNSGCDRFLHSEDKLSEKLKSYIESGATNFTLELRLKQSNGNYGWFRMVSELVQIDHKKYRICLLTSINEEKNLEGEIQKLTKDLDDERQMFDTVWESVPLGVVIGRAPDGKLIKYTKKMKDIWGDVGLNFNDIKSEGYGMYKGIHPDGSYYSNEDWPLFRSLYKHEFIHGEYALIERFGDNQRLTIKLHSAPVFDKNGKTIAAIVICENVNELEKMREEKIQLMGREQTALESSRLKSEFLANMSHEIRTPLNGVLGMSDLLQYTNLSTEQLDYVETIKNSGQLLLGIINDILDFSKIEAGKMDLENTLFTLPELVHHIDSIMRPNAILKKLDFLINLDPTLPLNYIGDPQRIKQILINLINNSIKFTSKGFVKVNFAGGEIAHGIYQLDCTVEDSGIGIPEHIVPLLFQPFTQGDSSNTRRYGGTGLGLSICRNLITMMEGKIKIESKHFDSNPENHGSCFSFDIKLKIPEKVHPDLMLEISSKTQMPPKNESWSELNLLIVEDNPINQKLLKKILALLGFTKMTSVDNGKEAVELYQNDPKKFHLILMDCQMPIMDGFEATVRIRRFEKENQLPNIPILAITASAFLSDQQKCKDAGMNDHIAKPISKVELANKLNDWL